MRGDMPLGIWINLTILPDKTTPVQWESADKETWKLISAYPFMDKLLDEVSYGTPVVYCGCTEKRVLHIDTYQGTGWNAIGDMDTLNFAENFTLFKNPECYGIKSQSNSEEFNDIFYSEITNEHGSKIHQGDIERVFHSKT